MGEVVRNNEDERRAKLFFSYRKVLNDNAGNTFKRNAVLMGGDKIYMGLINCSTMVRQGL